MTIFTIDSIHGIDGQLDLGDAKGTLKQSTTGTWQLSIKDPSDCPALAYLTRKQPPPLEPTIKLADGRIFAVGGVRKLESDSPQTHQFELLDVREIPRPGNE